MQSVQSIFVKFKKLYLVIQIKVQAKLGMIKDLRTLLFGFAYKCKNLKEHLTEIEKTKGTAV